MAQQNLPKIKDPSTTIYQKLLGVDYRADVTEVDRRRSPEMVNMISDLGGNPVKRYGYRRVADAYAGLVSANSEPYGVKTYGVGGVLVSKIEIDPTTGNITETQLIPVGDADFGEIKAVFGYQQYVFVMCEYGCVKVDVIEETYEYTGIGSGMMSTGDVGESSPICETIIPETSIALKPDGTDGSTLYGKNLMSIYQQSTYIGDGTSTEYIIPFYSKIGNWAKVEIMDSNGDWQVQESGWSLGTSDSMTGVSLDGTETMVSSVVDAKIIFTTAPAAPTQAGEPNVRITYAPFSTNDEVEIGGTKYARGFYNKTFVQLLQSKAHFFYEARMFMAVVEKTYYSDVNNPFMIADNYWFDVDNAVIAYQRVSSYLVVITKDTGKNTIFLAQAINDASTGDVQFSVKPSNAGVGAITGEVGGILNDEPIFLSSTGIYGILTNWNSEKYAVNRSGRINRKLCKERGLENAVGCAYNGYYYLAINGQMYVLDGRHKDSTRNGETSYECYYFNQIPDVKEMFVTDNRMFFTDEYNTYTWNDDMADTLQYYDHLVLDEEGQFVSGDAVQSRWCSCFDDDGSPQILKTLNKKGSMVTIVPHYKSGCEITLKKDGDVIQYLGKYDASIFGFDKIDFTMFTFATNQVATDIFTKKKVKKYKRLQIMIENNEAEPFGLTEVVKTYTYGNYAKR